MNKEKLARYSFYLWLLAWPWQTKFILSPSPSNYLEISFFLSWIFLIIPIGVWGYPILKKDYWRFGTGSSRPLWWWGLIILEAAFILSIFSALDVKLAVYHYFVFVIALTTFYLGKSNKVDFSGFSKFFIAGLIGPALLGIWQFLAQSSFSFKWLGLASHYAAVPGTAVIESGGLRYLRAYGSFDHPNAFGGIMAIILIYNLYLIFQTRYSIRNRFFYTASSLIFYAGLLVSFSRSSLLAFFAAAPFVFIYGLKRAKKITLIHILLIISLSAVFALQYKDLLLTRLSAEGRLESKSLQERVSYVDQSLFLIKKNPLSGVGAGNYVAAIKAVDKDFHESWFYQPVHNYWLLAWAELGVTGLIGLLIFWGASLIKAYQKKLGPIILTFGVISIFDHWLWTSAVGLAFMFMIFSIIFREDY